MYGRRGLTDGDRVRVAKQKRAELKSVLDPQTKKRVGELVCHHERKVQVWIDLQRS